MALEQARLFISIGAKVDDGVRGLGRVESSLGSLERRSRTVSSAVIGVTTKVIALGAAATAAALFLGKMAADTEADMTRVARVLTNTGAVVDRDLTASIENWVEQQRLATGIGGGQWRAALTALIPLTGSLAVAQQRAALAADLSVASGWEFLATARQIGRANEDALSMFRRLGLQVRSFAGGTGEAAAAQQLAARAGISYEQALAGIKRGGPGIQSVLRRHGIVLGGVNEKMDEAAEFARLMEEATRRFGGAAEADIGTASGQARLLASDWAEVGESFGQLFMPMFRGAVDFGRRAISGLRRAVMLFSTDIGGPRIKGVRALWKQIFGVEMPEALGAIVDMFEKIGERTGEFVDDLNSEDPDTVRGATKRLVADMPGIIRAGLGGIGEAFDEMGLGGQALKLVLVGLFASPVLTPALQFAGVLTGIAKDFVLIGAMAGTTGGAITLAVGLVLIAAWQVFETIKLIHDNWDLFVLALRSGRLSEIPVFGQFFELARKVDESLQTLAWAVRNPQTAFERLVQSIEQSFERAHSFITIKVNAIIADLNKVIRGINEITGLNLPTIGPIVKDTGPISDLVGRVPSPGPPPGGGAPPGPSAREVCLASGGVWNNVMGTCRAPTLGGAPQAPIGGPVFSFAHGGSMVAERPTLALFGEAGIETGTFTPGREEPRGGDLVMNIHIHGDVDSDARVQQLGREIARQAELLGMA